MEADCLKEELKQRKRAESNREQRIEIILAQEKKTQTNPKERCPSSVVNCDHREDWGEDIWGHSNESSSEEAEELEERNV